MNTTPDGDDGDDGDDGTDELLDVVDPTGALIGPELRSVVHRDGLWHQVFHCLVVRSGLPARVLLQRRSHQARAFPGLFDISVAGHLTAGERPTDGVREIREELGLNIDPACLVPLGQRLLADNQGEGGANREIAHVFLLTDDTPLANLRLDPTEAAGFAELAVTDLFALITAADAQVHASEVTPSGALSDVKIRSTDVVPPIGGYWTVLATMAERHASGLTPLAI